MIDESMLRSRLTLWLEPIERLVKQKENHWVLLYYILAVPSVMNSLETSNGEDTQKGYTHWADTYLGSSGIDGETWRNQRNALLHQGRTKNGGKHYRYYSGLDHNLEDCYLSVPRLANAVIEGINTWAKVVISDREKLDNLEKNIASLSVIEEIISTTIRHDLTSDLRHYASGTTDIIVQATGTKGQNNQLHTTEVCIHMKQFRDSKVRRSSDAG
jgi:hypothetical protein